MKRKFKPSLLNTVYLFTVLFFISTNALAERGAVTDEHRDFLKLYYFHRPELKIDYEFHTEVDEKDGPGSVQQQVWGLELDIPVFVSGETFYTWGGGYQSRMYDFSSRDRDASLSGDDNFQKVFLRAGVGHFFSRDLFFSAHIQPGLFSNFGDGLDEDALALYAEGVFVYRLNPGAQLIAGLRFSEDFDDSPLFPLLGVRLQESTGKFHISLTAPLNLTFSYHMDQNSFLYLVGDITGDRYSVSSESLSETFDAQFHQRKVGIGVERWLTGHVTAGLELGATVESELRFKSDNVGEFRSGNLEEGLYIRVKLTGSF